MKTNNMPDTARYRVIADKHGVTTVVYLSSGVIVVTVVNQDGSVETSINPP